MKHNGSAALVPESKDEVVMRHIAKAWMCDYRGLNGYRSQFALTLPGQSGVVAFVDVQVHPRPAKDFPDIPVGLLAFSTLAAMSERVKRPGLIVAGFEDGYVFVSQDAIRKPLDVRCVKGDAAVYIRADQFAPVRYESKW